MFIRVLFVWAKIKSAFQADLILAVEVHWRQEYTHFIIIKKLLLVQVFIL